MLDRTRGRAARTRELAQNTECLIEAKCAILVRHSRFLLDNAGGLNRPSVRVQGHCERRHETVAYQALQCDKAGSGWLFETENFK